MSYCQTSGHLESLHKHSALIAYFFLQAFLRIRPCLEDAETSYEPYLEPLTDTSVRLTDPSSSSAHSRMSTISPSSIYTFSHVFPPDTNQSDFFSKTTLPLVRDVLEGRNGLLFAYGVTNSGKTYTIQGGSEVGSAGIIPRTLDVIFNSIEGLHGDAKVSVRHHCFAEAISSLVRR